jgi:putative ABC transport system permease protein
MNTALQDLRYALRMMANNLGFTAVAVLTLALGIGANTAIFSYVDATWLRPLPVRDSDRLVKIFTEGRDSRGAIARGDTAYQDYLEIRSQSKALEDMVAYERRGALLYRPGEVHQLPVVTVSPNYFTALGVSATIGRTFAEADFQNGRFPIVISYSLWQQQFGADKDVVGKEVRLTNGLVTVLGVMPREFRGLDLFAAPAVWIPAPTWTHITGDNNTFSQRSSRRQEVVARLRDGADLNTAQSELATIATRMAQAYPDTDKDLRLTVEREQDTRGEDTRRQGTVLLAISGMVLLIACANVVNLQLARSEARRREFATRLALGGSSGRVLRQLLTESLLLASMGIACALFLADWVIASLPRLFAAGFSGSGYDFRLDARVLLFTIGGTFAAVVLFGIVPGLRASRIDLVSDIKGASETKGHASGFPLRDVLVAAQVALSVLLLVGAGLLIRTFFKVQAIDPGFNARQNMLLVDLVPGLAGYTEPQIQNYYRTLIENMNALPGVEKAALAVRVPFSPSGGGAQQDVLLPGMTPPAGQTGYPVNFTWVGPDYFNVIGTRVQQGRGIENGDTTDTQRVAVINATLAKRFWPSGDAVGRTLQVTGRFGTALKTPVEFQVVGVVEDAKWNALTEPARPLMYLSLFQRAESEVTLLLRTSGEPAALTAGVRRELMRVDKNVPMLATTSLKQHIAFTLNTERTRALLSGAFGALGLLLAAAGIYGVLSYFISRRTREIGLRIALGAARGNVLGWVIRHGMRLVVIGIAVGLGAALLLSRALEGLLFGVHPTDPLTLALVVAVLVAVALLAIYLPARRASSVDPMEALRDY